MDFAQAEGCFETSAWLRAAGLAQSESEQLCALEVKAQRARESRL